MKTMILLFSLMLSMAASAIEYNEQEKSISFNHKDISLNKISLYRGNLATSLVSFDSEMMKDNIDLSTAKVITEYSKWAIGIALNTDELYFLSCERVALDDLSECVEYKNKIIKNIKKKKVKLYLTRGEVTYIEL